MRTRMTKEDKIPALYPAWSSKKTIRELLGVSDGLLYALVANGTVAFVKTGESKQAAALYNFEDVRKWLDAKAVRKVPETHLT